MACQPMAQGLSLWAWSKAAAKLSILPFAALLTLERQECPAKRMKYLQTSKETKQMPMSKASKTTAPQLEDSIQLIGDLLTVGQTLCQQPLGVGERLSQEVRRATQGRARLELAHAPSSVAPFPVCARFALQVRHRVYGTLEIAADPAHPASPALPLPVAELLAQTCTWLLYTLDLSAFMQGQGQRLDHQLADELTRREREVLTLLCRGYNQQVIATLLHLAPTTVQTHCKRLCQKLGVHCQRDLPLAAYQAHLFPIPQ